jgi:6-phosphogluconolactonase
VSGETPGTVVVLPDLDALSHEAAQIFVLLSQASIAARGKFAVALSGGSTPRALYSLLAQERYSGAVEWNKVHLFWADERCVPPDHPASNFKLASETFISSVTLPSENSHRIKGEKEAAVAAGEYEQDIRAFFAGEGVPAFDLVILGVGEDGHTASLFPGSSALTETKRFAVPVLRKRPGPDRVTLTLPSLNNALHVLFLAAGKTKAAVLREIIDEGNRMGHPAGLLRPARGSVRWLLDRDAASQLHTT